MYVNKFEGLRASWEEASWCSRALFSLKKDLGRLDKDMCNIAWSMFLISQCESSCFKSFVSAQCLQQYFSKTFLCRNILKERTFFLGRVRESPSDRRHTKLRMVCILNFIYISLSSLLLHPGSSHFGLPPTVPLSALLPFPFFSPNSVLPMWQGFFQWHFLYKVFSDLQAHSITSLFMLPEPFQVSLSWHPHHPLWMQWVVCLFCSCWNSVSSGLMSWYTSSSACSMAIHSFTHSFIYFWNMAF